MNWKDARIATSYPALTRYLLEKQGVKPEIVELSGSVEIAPGLGTADAISDLVSTGTTLRANHLRELDASIKARLRCMAASTTFPKPNSRCSSRLLAAWKA